MRMTNQMTNEQNLVKHIVIKNRIDVWKTLKSSSQGFSLEVFQDNKHLVSISTLSPDRVTFDTYLKGNLILEINLGLRTVIMRGQLHMADGWTRGYEIELLLHVSQPMLFAQHYQQRSDPIALAQKEVERILEIRTIRETHDSLNVEHLRAIADLEFSRATVQRCGVTIDAVNHLVLAMDNKRAEINQIRHNAYMNEIQDDLETQRTGRRADFQRQQNQINNQLARRERILDAHAEGMATRIEGDYRDGYNPADILAQYPQLQAIQGEQPAQITGPAPDLLLPPAQLDNTPLLRIKEVRQITEEYQPNATEGVIRQLPPQPVDATPGLTVKARRIPGQPAPQPMPAPQVPEQEPRQLYNARLGLTLTPLSDSQQASLGPHVSACYIVEAVDPNGAAERGRILPGDYLVSMNDQPITSEQALQEFLSAATPAATSTLRVLRAGQLFDLDMRI